MCSSVLTCIINTQILTHKIQVSCNIIVPEKAFLKLSDTQHIDIQEHGAKLQLEKQIYKL